MAASNQLSIIDQLVLSAPKGQSPYAYAADFIAHVIPDKPDWYYYQLTLSGILGAINLFLTLANFVVVYRRENTGKQPKTMWFFQKRYAHPTRIPYVMPNPLTMFLFWNTIFMLLFQPYTWLNYVAYKTPSRAVTSKMYFWYGFVFVWDGAGIWMSAFGTLYTVLLPRITFGERQNASILLHPLLMNTLCFGMPFLLFVTQIISSTLAQIAWGRYINIQFDLIDNLTTLSEQWVTSNGTSVDNALRRLVSEQGNDFISASMHSTAALIRSAWTSAIWYQLCFILFTPPGIWLLVTIKRAASRPGYISDQVSTRPSAPSVEAGGANIIQMRLRVGYTTVLLQFLTTIVCLGAAAMSFAWLAIDFDRMSSNPRSQAVAILTGHWLSSAVGTAVNTLILIRLSFKPSTRVARPSEQHSTALSASHIHFNNPGWSRDETEKPTSSYSHAEFELDEIPPDPLRNPNQGGKHSL